MKSRPEYSKGAAIAVLVLTMVVAFLITVGLGLFSLFFALIQHLSTGHCMVFSLLPVSGAPTANRQSRRITDRL
jgi:hypothetical protein